jgi:hypothetical protein
VVFNESTPGVAAKGEVGVGDFVGAVEPWTVVLGGFQRGPEDWSTHAAYRGLFASKLSVDRRHFIAPCSRHATAGDAAAFGLAA